MNKTIKRAILITEILILGGLGILVFVLGVGDLPKLFQMDTSIPKRMAVEKGSAGEISFVPTSEIAATNIENSPVEVEPTLAGYQCGPPEGWLYYQVQSGDVLVDLVENTGTTLKEFQSANCLGDSKVIVAGMGVFLPASPVTSTATTLPTKQPEPTATPAPTEEVEQLEISPTPVETSSGEPQTSFWGRSSSDWVEIYPGRFSGYVVRPGTGWQYYWSSPRVNTVPQTVAYGERDATSWDILNPAEDVYDWAPIDDQIALAVGRGEQFAFRVYTSAESHKVPQWALNAGVTLLPNGDIDYSNCIYQEKWGKFVNALAARYDGNGNIAYIDISGYSDYNEWAWEDQTVWDYVWSDHYAAGTASASTMSEIDSYSRRRLADMFIGGSFQGHICKSGDGTSSVSYSYPGFQRSQLVLPYAGIRQTTQYVFLKRPDVGLRNDGLGTESSNGIYEKLSKEINVIWRNAPIVLETTIPSQFVYANAVSQMRTLHGSLIHNAKIDFTDGEIVNLLGNGGYRYTLLGAGFDSVVAAGDDFEVRMGWRNVGSTPAYPRMGQTFKVYLYLTDLNDNVQYSYLVDANVAGWYPSHGSKDIPRGTHVGGFFTVPGGLAQGAYKLKVAIIHDWSGNPIQLDVDLNHMYGLYELGVVTVTEP